MVFLWQNNGTGLLFKDQNSNAKERVAMAIDFSISIHSEDIVDQSKIPHITLRGGDKMPAIGMGTYHNEIYTYEEVAQAVYGAIHIGYRLIDCASGYQDEPQIGEALEAVMAEGIRRDQLFITSKLDTIHMAPDEVLPALHRTLRDLRLDYLDGYYMQYPNCSGQWRTP